MPQLAICQNLVHAVSEVKKDSSVKTVHVRRAGAYSALAWFRQRRQTAGSQWEDKMFPMQASKPWTQEKHSHCPAGWWGGGVDSEIDVQQKRYTWLEYNADNTHLRRISKSWSTSLNIEHLLIYTISNDNSVLCHTATAPLCTHLHQTQSNSSFKIGCIWPVSS